MKPSAPHSTPMTDATGEVAGPEPVNYITGQSTLEVDGVAVGGGGGATGTVTSFSAGDCAPLFTTAEATTTTTPALSFALTNAAAHAYLGNNTGGSGAPDYHVIAYSELSGTPTIPDAIFKTIAVSGQSDVVADSTTDTLTLAAGAGITLTTNAGTDTVTVAATATAQTHAVTFVCDGAGSAVSTGTKAYTKIPYGGTITGWTLVGTPSGSVTVDILRAANGAGLPVTSIIGAGTKPALSGTVEGISLGLGSWTSTTLTAFDNLAISLSGITSTTYVALTLYFS